MNWEQFRAILWLRFRLSRNQFIRAGKFNAVLSIIMFGLLLVAGLGLGVAGLLLGPLAATKASPGVLLLICDGLICGFLFVWLTGLMVDLQRSESIDLDRLLSLPISLKQVFVLNYAASHFTPSIILFLPAIIGFCLGVVFGAGPLMLLLLPLALSFILMITAWTYCLRGWLAALMMNKRRRRAIVVWITAGFILLSQLPNILVHSRMFRGKTANSRSSNPSAPDADKTFPPETFIDMHRPIPLGWVGFGAFELRQGRALAALGATAASCFLGLLGLMRAYRLTLRFYTGADQKIAPAATAAPRVHPASTSSRKRLLVERQLPFLRDDIAGLALATFRSLSRAPELKMALIMPVIFGVVGLSMAFSASKNAAPWPLRELAAPMAVFLTAFFLAPTMANTFGLDRNGFRALVLLPTRRDHLLFAKNLAFFPFLACTAAILAILAALLTHASVSALLTALVEIPAVFLLVCLPCNLTSMLAPFRLAPGSLKAKRPKAIVIIAILLNMVAEPIVVAPLLIPSGLQLLFSFNHWVPWLPVNLLAALAILALIAGLYWLLLAPLGRLLQHREQAILREVTEEVE